MAHLDPITLLFVALWLVSEAFSMTGKIKPNGIFQALGMMVKGLVSTGGSQGDQLDELCRLLKEMQAQQLVARPSPDPTPPPDQPLSRPTTQSGGQ